MTHVLTLSPQTKQPAWAEALEDYQAETVAYAAVSAEHSAAAAEYNASVSHRADEFAQFGLQRWSDPNNRDSLMMRVEVSIIMRDFKGRRDPLTPEELGSIRRRAAIVADDFIQWAAAWDAAAKKFEPSEKKFDEAADKLFAARKRLLSTPAPDSDAMLFKMNLLLAYMRDCDAEDVSHVASIVADAQRLVGAQ